MLKVLLVGADNPNDPRAWSGTAFKVREALARQFPSLTVLHLGTPKRTLPTVLLRLLFGGHRPRYPLWMTQASLKAFGRRLAREVQRVRPDVVVSISSQGLVDSPGVGVPVVMFSDAPWMACQLAYRGYDVMPLLARRYADMEAEAARRATEVVVATEWAFDEALAHYPGVGPERISVVPLGANNPSPFTSAQIAQQIEQRARDRLQFLYLGKDWVRKGGPFAIEVCRTLRARGLEATLDIVGCRPEIAAADAGFVKVHGMLRASDAKQKQQLESLFSGSHFLIVPSRAEAFGVVFAEAQSYGLPCLALAVHGVQTVVRHGQTGLLFQHETPVGQWADEISALFGDVQRYGAMARAARAQYETRLNWDSFGVSMRQIVERAAGAGRK